MDVLDATTEPPDIRKNNTVLNKTNVNVPWPSLPLSIHLLYTISGGRHFPPKINDNCLPWLQYKSFFYAVNRIQSGKLILSYTHTAIHVELCIEGVKLYASFMMFKGGKYIYIDIL